MSNKSEYENALGQLSGWRVPTGEEKEYVEGCIINEGRKEDSNKIISIVSFLVVGIGLFSGVTIQLCPQVLSNADSGIVSWVSYLAGYILITALSLLLIFNAIRYILLNYERKSLEIVHNGLYRVCDIRYERTSVAYSSYDGMDSNNNGYVNVFDLNDKPLMSIPSRRGVTYQKNIPVYRSKGWVYKSNNGILIAVNTEKKSINYLFVYPIFGEVDTRKMIEIRRKNI